jgi:hypothetical protein
MRDSANHAGRIYPKPYLRIIAAAVVGMSAFMALFRADAATVRNFNLNMTGLFVSEAMNRRFDQ